MLLLAHKENIFAHKLISKVQIFQEKYNELHFDFWGKFGFSFQNLHLLDVKHLCNYRNNKKILNLAPSPCFSFLYKGPQPLFRYAFMTTGVVPFYTSKYSIFLTWRQETAFYLGCFKVYISITRKKKYLTIGTFLYFGENQEIFRWQWCFSSCQELIPYTRICSAVYSGSLCQRCSLQSGSCWPDGGRSRTHAVETPPDLFAGVPLC